LLTAGCVADDTVATTCPPIPPLSSKPAFVTTNTATTRRNTPAASIHNANKAALSS